MKPDSHFPGLSQTLTSGAPQCSGQALSLREKFMWYAPHSGFGNQLLEFKHAVLMAGILNRILVVPPILDHHAVVLGSYPKFRMAGPKDIRISVWDHMVELVQGGSVKQCGSLLAWLHGNIEKCIYAVNEDCITTVWTYDVDGYEDGVLDSFQPNELLKQKKKISYVRRRRDVFKTLGPGSEVESASMLEFGSLFSSPYKGSELYVDIHESHQDQRFLSLTEKIKFLLFVPEVMIAGKEFAKETIKAPFLCAQLRSLDGQFKNHQKATFHGLRQKLESLRQKGPLPIHIFVMTDLPRDNWTDSYLGDLFSGAHNYEVYFLREDDQLVRQAANRLMAAGSGQRFIPNSDNRVGKKYCSNQRLPDL